jgi:hypothetical protein
VITLFHKARMVLATRCSRRNSAQPTPSVHIASCSEKWVSVPRLKQTAFGAVTRGDFLSSTVSNTSEEARWITLLTEPCVYFYCAQPAQAWYQDAFCHVCQPCFYTSGRPDYHDCKNVRPDAYRISKIYEKYARNFTA